MLFTRLALVAAVCAGTALASTADKVTKVPRSLHVRRDVAEDLEAAQAIASGLAASAGQAVANGGECSGECEAWVGAMGECVTASTLEASAQCVCNGSAIAQMGTCGNCLGGENTEGAASLAKICADYASQIGGESSSSSSTATASDTSAASSSAASSASDAKTSAASAASSIASAITADPSATSAPGEQPDSGANKFVVAGSAVLAAAGAVALLAL